ncbi:MAG: hypothetical protein ACYC6J_10020 [Coriobacteriia bacterium]|jgi:hypothetical protein
MIDATSGTARPNYDTLQTLRLLRLHGFALTFYGGKALHAGAGAPTADETWRSALERLAESITREGEVSEQHAHELIATIAANLFDLNAVEPASAGAAVAAAITSGAAKVC